jgi:hypothetical protein
MNHSTIQKLESLRLFSFLSLCSFFPPSSCEVEGEMNDAVADGVDPLLLLLLIVGDEVHGLSEGGELEGELAVEHVLGAIDGAAGDGDDAVGDQGPHHGGVLEPEESALLEHEPPLPPRLGILTLLVQPPRLLHPMPELDAPLHIAAQR